VAGLRRSDAAFGAAPRHHHRTGREAAFKDFIPANHSPVFAGEELFQTMIDPSLKFRLFR
jgi:hypothetical protein